MSGLRIGWWQRRLNGAQKRFAVGCLLDVPVRGEVEDAGFELDRIDEDYPPKISRIQGYMYDGLAPPSIEGTSGAAGADQRNSRTNESANSCNMDIDPLIQLSFLGREDCPGNVPGMMPFPGRQKPTCHAPMPEFLQGLFS